MQDNIVLIGFMGTGKDTIGRMLARKLKMEFISTDNLIELSEGRCIKEIFERDGEAYFRKLEENALKTIKGLKNIVIATGGGIVINPENRIRLRKIGRVIQLDAELPALKRRIITRDKRPLIRNQSDIETLYRKRSGMYDFAEIRVNTTRNSPQMVVDEIIHTLMLQRNYIPVSRTKVLVRAKSRSYPVIIGVGILDILRNRNSRTVVVSNPLVSALYLEKVLASLNNHTKYVVIPDGEKYKTLKTAELLYDFLQKNNFQRSDLLVSLGGGVISDIAGFVAATFKRGIRLIHIPTTLLGQVDAAIGGKNGVNTDNGKNLIGTFYQPEMVICDLKTITTLSDKEFKNGIAEIVKYALIKSPELFRILKDNIKAIKKRDPGILSVIVEKCVTIKSEIINKDETERLNTRQILNFGHTIGHVVETLTGYKKYSHGEAVSMGMIEEIRLFRGNEQRLNEIKRLLENYGLPVKMPEKIKSRDIKMVLIQDKKIWQNRIRMPVFKDIGRVHIKEVLCEDLL